MTNSRAPWTPTPRPTRVVCVVALVAALSAVTGSASAQGLIALPSSRLTPLRDAAMRALDAPVITPEPAVAEPSEPEGFAPALDIDVLRVGSRELAAAGPIDGRERVNWVVRAVAGPANLGFTAFGAARETWWTQPTDQARAARFARSFAIRELDLAISRSVEAGLGALWDEDPRRWQATSTGFWPKTGRALQRLAMAPRADGHLAPAWGRFAGFAASGIAANAWVPEDRQTVPDTALRIGSALTGRLISNLWREVWPDLKERLPQPPWARRTADQAGLPR